MHIVTKRGLKFWPRFVKMSSLWCKKLILVLALNAGPNTHYARCWFQIAPCWRHNHISLIFNLPFTIGIHHLPNHVMMLIYIFLTTKLNTLDTIMDRFLSHLIWAFQSRDRASQRKFTESKLVWFVRFWPFYKSIMAASMVLSILQAYSLMLNRGHSQNCQNLIFLHIFIALL